jgi:hypothetical protein
VQRGCEPIKCLMVLHFLCSMGLHCRLRIGGCCQFENISTICWCCCISNYSCCGLWICCLLSMPDSLGLCTTVTNLLLQLGVDSQPSFSSFQSLFFFFQCLIVGIFSFFQKMEHFKIISRELQMMSEEERSVTSKIGLEGLIQESGELLCLLYIYSWECITLSKGFAFLNLMFFSSVIGY